MDKGQRVKESWTGKTGTVVADFGIFVHVTMDDGEQRKFQHYQLEETPTSSNEEGS